MNRALVNYVDFINYRRSLFGHEPWDVYDNYAELREEIDVLGDPEILSGDGEYSRAETQRRTDDWLDAMAELDRIGQELMA